MELELECRSIGYTLRYSLKNLFYLLQLEMSNSTLLQSLSIECKERCPSVWSSVRPTVYHCLPGYIFLMAGLEFRAVHDVDVEVDVDVDDGSGSGGRGGFGMGVV